MKYIPGCSAQNPLPYGYLNRAFSDVFAHPSRVEVQGQSIFTLEETHHLFYLLCHSFKHFLHGGIGIRQICDMVQMIRIYGRKIDWEMFWQLCEEYHMTCFCINLLDIGERYLAFPMKQVGSPCRKEASLGFRSASDRYSRCRFVRKIERGTDPQCKHYPVCGRNRNGKAHSRGNLEIAGSGSFLYEKQVSLCGEVSVFCSPAAYVQRILKWLGQGDKEQKSSIEVGAGRVELLKKYDMIRTADGKKRGDAHAGRIQREK